MTQTPGSVAPIAVVGIGCRFPGGVIDADSFWRLMIGGVDAIAPVGADRWDSDRFYSPRSQQRGRMNAREGGFLSGVDEFDAAFFGISRRVAEQMDPQQRLLLEVCWEAFEDAGIVPESMAGSRAGVFVGACSQDYSGIQNAPDEVEGLGPHSATGTFMSILSNRLSYTFDLRGPSMTVDTACSSSLVAVHLACESLHRGESEIAIAGGVNLMLTPQFAIALSQASMLSPDGRSRAFDADANGYVRGEGAGVVVLKPLDRALLDRDRIYAVVRGTAVNQDGRTQGITVPSGESQEANFRAALATARVAPAEVGFVEAHGTGTAVGDPIECTALGRVLREGRTAGQDAYVGSVKTNIGHLEAGAGIAGFIKAALSVHKRRIPPNLHFRTPNPEIDFEELRIAVPTEAVPWPARYDRAVASVNSFGFGGTNANAVLSEPPPPSVDPLPEDAPTVLVLSARSEAALRQLAEQHANLLESTQIDLHGVARNLAERRTHHGHRLAITAFDRADAVARLRKFVADGVGSGRARKRPGKVAFVFNGQGPQWFAMGRTLLETSSVFRSKVQQCDDLAKPVLGWSIYEALLAPTEELSRIHQTHCLQPTMFAVQVALVELWRSWGVEPDGVVGHSMGEIAAAHVAGALDLSTALEVICRRARIQEKADPTGAMMFVAVSREEAVALCEDGRIWISAENSPKAFTLSGRRDALEALSAKLQERGVFSRMLKVGCACHSQDMDPLRDELLSELADVVAVPAVLPMYSTVTGEPVRGEALGPGYWWRNFRQPVLFASAITAMRADGYDTFIEISPHPVLRNSLNELLAGQDDVLALSTLAKGKDDWEQFLGALGTLHTSGVRVEWDRRHAGPAAVLDLPKNPWMRERFWNESEVSRRHRLAAQTHPMIERVDATRPAWEIRWDDHRLTWVKEHDVFGSVIVPGAAYVETALAAASELTGERCALEFVEFERPCVLDPDEPQISRIELDPDTGSFELHHRPVRGDRWIRNARGRYRRDEGLGERIVFDLDAIRRRCPDVHQPADIYALMKAKGYAYGPAFCGIERLHVGPGEALARVRTPRVLRNRMDGYLYHPAVLDACFQSSILHPAEDQPGTLLPYTYLPTSIERVRLHGDPRTGTWCYTRLNKLNSTGLSVDVFVLDDEGLLIAEYAPLKGKVVRQTSDPEDVRNHLYRPVWTAEAVVSGRGRSALTEGPRDVAAGLEARRNDLSTRLGRRSYSIYGQNDLRALCCAYVVDALRAFGHGMTTGETFTLADFSGLQPRYERLLTGYLGHLVAQGLLADDDGRYRVQRDWTSDAAVLWREVMERHPSCVWELLLLRRTGGHLHAVLTGETDPLELLFPAGSQDETEPIYQSSPIARFHNALVRAAVERFVASADPRRTLRVLEVGGGTGGLTANVLPVLPSDRCEYVFSDISPAFVQASQERFGSVGFLTSQTLDLESDLADQGITPGSFDLVLASDVVHATSDVRRTLLHLQEALTPGGVLALIEAQPGNMWLDLTFGLTSGWWAFRDLDLRPSGPLLTAPAWVRTLESVGFEEPVALGDGERAAGGQTVLLARAPEQPGGAPSRRPEQPVGDWVVVADRGGLADAVVRQLEALGGTARIVRPHEGYGDAFTGSSLDGVVHLGNVDDNTPADSCTDLVQLLQVLDRLGQSPRVCVVTRGSQGHRNTEIRPSGAPVWGLGLVAGLELPATRCKMIDLDPTSDADEVDTLVAELLRDDDEREVALRAGDRFTRRIVPLGSAKVESTAPAAQLPASTGFVLEMTETGSFDDLTYRAVNRVAPEDLQVEVAVSAAGLNFLDAMTALGQVPTLDCVDEYRFGAECAGVVTRIGARVTGLSVGDEVVAVSGTQGALASHITLDEKCVAPKPAELSFEEAASVPIVFLTAWYGLHKLARLEAGEKVLIHSAAGGTGLAAIQIARLLGAEVFATAGSEEKRDLLRSLGIEHVMDSRSLTFADEVLAATGGAGVDVVISAAVGELADRTMACVAPYGRYVEIGKKDLLTDRKIGLRPFLRNLAYFAFDLRQLLVDRPAAVRAELDTLLDLFRSGSLRPLPFRVFHPSQTETAFRHLASARHIGKLVIALDEQEIEVAAARAPAAPQGTWLITGGCGGVGLGMAEALVDSGVRSLVLLGRGGAESVEARARVAGLRSRGAGVVVEAVDVTCRTELEGVFERIARDLPPLRGVLHCAMVLDDALITAVTPEQVRRVLAPKVDGARHLNSLTEKLDLDAFVLFSSAASLVGNIGQAHYAAANAYLDQLAEARHAAGLPALSVHWGAVSDAGYVARHPEVARLVEATGMRGFPVRQAFAAMTTLWRGPYARVAVIPMNWPQFFRHHAITPQRNPRYALLTSEAQLGGASSGGPLSVQLRSQTSDGRAELLKSRLKERVATVLGIPLAELDESMPLMDYLDSLLAVEISSWLEREVGVKVTIIELMKGPSVSQLTEDLLARIEVPSQRSSTELFEFAKV